jgi:cell division protein FtsN
MTDIDRGAYAPQHDGPSMSFDPRRGRARQPAPFTLIFSGVVLVALVAAIVMFYQGGVRQAGDAPATVGQPVVAMKGPATVEAKPLDEAESLDVYVGEETAVAAAPAFAAPPEQPQPRPAPRPAPVVVAAAAPTVAPRAVAAAAPSAKPATVAAEPKPVQVAAAKPAVSKPAAAPVAPAPKPVQVAAAAVETPASVVTTPVAAPVASTLPPARANPTVVAAAVTAATTPAPAAAAPVSTGGRYGVQIGAFTSPALAESEYAKVASRFSVAGKGKVVTPVPSGGSTLYRTVVTGFGSREQAAALCSELKAAGRDCFVKGS